MFGALALVFLVVPVIELVAIIKVGQVIGAWNTIGLLLLVSVVGAWLVKREGIAVWRRFQRQMQAGAVPGRELADGVLILAAGALLLTPGFLTDVCGLLLLLPPVRAGIRGSVLRRLTGRIYRVRRGF